MLRRVSKITGGSDLEHIKRATRIPDANTLKTNSGLDFSVEKMLGRVEDFYPSIIARLNNDPFSEDDERWIRALIAVQMGRDPFYRYWLAEEVTYIKAALTYALRDDDPLVTESEVEEEFDYYARRAIVKSHIDPNPHNVAIAGTSFLIRRYYEDLASLSLTIFRAPKGSFMTADSPLFLYDRYALAARNDDEACNAGFLPETEITLPLTSQYAALLSTGGAANIVDAERVHVAIINARTVRSANEFVYMNPTYSDYDLRIDIGSWWWRHPLI